MLLQLHKYIQQERIVSLQQLVREFQIDELALLPMLNYLQQKGIVFSAERKKHCQSVCQKCSPSKVVFYLSQN